MKEFVQLPIELEKDLEYLINNYNNNDVIQGMEDYVEFGNHDDFMKVKNLMECGYLKECFKGIRHYIIKFSIEDKNYNFFKEKYQNEKNKSITYNIQQQINAHDNANVTITQINYEKSIELRRLINNIKSEIAELSEETKNSITENLDFIEEETTKEKPKTSMIKNTLSVLTAVKHTAEFSAAVTALVSFFSNL